MAKRNNRIIIIVVFLAAILIGGYALSGQITNDGGGGTTGPVDLNTVATTKLFSRNGLTITQLDDGGTITVSQYDTLLQDTQLFIRIDFTGSVDAGEVFNGVLRSGLISVESTAAFNEGQDGVWFFVFDLGSCLMGKHSYVVDYRGEYATGGILMTGSSFPFYIDNLFEPEIDPPEITSPPADFQIQDTQSITLSWTINSISDYTVQLHSDGFLIDTQSYTGSEIPQVYSFTFSSDFEGQKVIVMSIVGTGVSDEVQGYIVGGSVEPPAILQHILPIAIGGIILIVIIVVVTRRK